MPFLTRMQVAAFLITTAVAGLAPTASAGQTPAPLPLSGQSSFFTTPAFVDLVNRKSLVVRTNDGRLFEGHFQISGNTLVMYDEKTVTTVPFDAITRIQKSTYRIRMHTLIGAAVGTAVGIAVFADCNGCQTDEWVFVVPVWAGIGAGIGAAVGGILNRINAQDDLVYDAATRTRTLAIAPVISPARKGVNVVITWR